MFFYRQCSLFAAEHIINLLAIFIENTLTFALGFVKQEKDEENTEKNIKNK